MSHKDRPKIGTYSMSSAIFPGVYGRKKSEGKPVAKIKPTTIFHITGLPRTSSGALNPAATGVYYLIVVWPPFLTQDGGLRFKRDHCPDTQEFIAPFQTADLSVPRRPA